MPVLPLTTDFASHVALAIGILALILALRRWPWLYAVFTWPGTVAHELLHFAMGLLTGAQPVSLSIVPNRQQDGSWVLGEVRFARLRWWNSIPVGLAPLALLPVGGWLFWEAARLPVWSWHSAGLSLATVQCLCGGWPSRRDWVHAFKGLLVAGLLGLLGLCLWFVFFR